MSDKATEDTLERKFIQILRKAQSIAMQRDRYKLQVADLEHKMIAVGSPKPSEGGGGGSSISRDQKMISLIMKKDIAKANYDIRQAELDWIVKTIYKVSEPCAVATIICKFILGKKPKNYNIDHHIERYITITEEILKEWEDMQHMEVTPLKRE